MPTLQYLEPALAPPRSDVAALPDDPARISFRQPVSTAGCIDAAWWPRSLDLAAELPQLLDVLWTAGREISRVTYSIAGWDPAPRQISVEGRTVRLGGFADSDVLTIRLTDAWRTDRVDILVIAPDTDPALAQRTLLFARQANDPDRTAEILARARKPISDRASA
jgi:hypothetical protein